MCSGSAVKRVFITRVCIFRRPRIISSNFGDYSVWVESYRCMIPVLIDVDKAHRCTREIPSSKE